MQWTYHSSLCLLCEINIIKFCCPDLIPWSMVKISHSTDHSSVREESSSNTGSNNSSSPAARMKKTDFKDDSIGEVGVQLFPPTTV